MAETEGIKFKRFADYLKYRSDTERIVMLHPLALALVLDFIIFCHARNLPCVITDSVSTPAEDLQLKRKSDTHRSGRAFDASLRGWTEDSIKEVTEYFNKKYPDLGARSSEDPNKTRLVYAHNAGTGMHLHFQINRDHILPDIEL
jgi:hypothetical protein